MRVKFAWSTAAALFVLFCGGCVEDTQLADGGPGEPRAPSAPRPPARAGYKAPPAGPAVPWTCQLAVTFDRDWHNDVWCTNGRESLRPYLLPEDEYITETEIRQAAEEYAQELNERSMRQGRNRLAPPSVAGTTPSSSAPSCSPEEKKANRFCDSALMQLEAEQLER